MDDLLITTPITPMNILDQLQVKQNPALFPFEVAPLEMSPYEVEYLPAIVSELLNISILRVDPLVCVGCVGILNVTPYKKMDPRFIFCRTVDLKWYQYLWARVVTEGVMSSEEVRGLVKYFDDEFTKTNLGKLEKGEGAFLLLELLRFKNEFLRRIPTFQTW